MDIVLTISKRHQKRHNDILRDVIDGKCVLEWTFKRKPKIEVGDYVHFAKGNRVEYFMTVIRINDSIRKTLLMDYPQWHTEIIEARGFQGFRYKWWDSD
jgi:hypothetical protein